MRRIVITGGTGILALNWACAVRKTWDVYLLTHLHSVQLEGASSLRLRLGDRAAVVAGLDSLSPDLVVHTAGMTNVEACERDPKAARFANVELAENVAAAAREIKVAFIHISTDHLFAGKKSFTNEDVAPTPLNAYAQTKLEAERAVLELYPEALVIRTNFYGWGHAYRKSITDWIIEAMESGACLNMFHDVYFTPTLVDQVVSACHRLVGLGRRGVWNVVGDERIPKFQFALAVAEIFDLPTDSIARISVESHQFEALRPRDMSLGNERLRNVLGEGLGDVRSGLLQLRRQAVAGRRAELMAAVRPTSQEGT